MRPQSMAQANFNLEEVDSVGTLEKEKLKERLVTAIRKEHRATETFDLITRISSIDGEEASGSSSDSENTPPTKGGSKAVSSSTSTHSNSGDRGEKQGSDSESDKDLDTTSSSKSDNSSDSSEPSENSDSESSDSEVSDKHDAENSEAGSGERSNITIVDSKDESTERMKRNGEDEESETSGGS